MRWTFFGVLVFAAGLLLLEFRQRLDAECALLATRAREHAQELDFILKDSSDAVSALQLSAETWFRQHPTLPPASPLFQHLVDHATEGHFTLDDPPATYQKRPSWKHHRLLQIPQSRQESPGGTLPAFSQS